MKNNFIPTHTKLLKISASLGFYKKIFTNHYNYNNNTTHK